MPQTGTVGVSLFSLYLKLTNEGRGKAGFFWAGSCSLCFLWAYFRLPETKDRSPAELDRLFIDKVPARKFKQTTVDVFDDETQAAVKTV